MIFLSKCKNGDFRIDYEWNESQLSKIPSLHTLNDFVENEVFTSLVNKSKYRLSKVMENLNKGITGIDSFRDKHINVTITGKPGTGKTTTAYALAAALGLPIYTTACTKNTEEDEFEGKNKVIDGKLQFVSTNFLEAYENGGIIVLEEVNLADPAVIMGALGQAVEFPYVLMKNGYEQVNRHPLCVIISTMNVGTFGSKGVSQAFSSRFKQTYLLDDPKKEDFINILIRKGFDSNKSTWVYNAYDKILSYLKSPRVNAEDLCMNVTLRSCIGALENMEEGSTSRKAIEDTLIGKIAEVDLELASSITNDVVANLVELK